MKRQTCMALPLLAFICEVAWAQSNIEAESIAEKVDMIAQQALVTHRLPGLALVVLDGGESVVAKGYGSAHVDNHVQMTPASVFPTGSLTKQFAAAAVMVLVERGDVDLTAPIARYLPEFTDSVEKVTVEHLLRQTSGIPFGFSPDDFPEFVAMHAASDLADYPYEDAVAIMSRAPRDFDPGEWWAYSNANYLILSAWSNASREWGWVNSSSESSSGHWDWNQRACVLSLELT